MQLSSYFVETRWGGSEESPSSSRLAEIIAELDVEDEEHPDTWLVHIQSGWMIRLDEERFAYLEDGDGKTIRHMLGVTSEQAHDLWLRFAWGGPEAVGSDRWLSGPRVYTAAETKAIHARSRALTLESDRQFFQSLGPEDRSRPCKRPGCSRGAIKYSTLCAPHHFEQLRGKPYPLLPPAPGDA